MKKSKREKYDLLHNIYYKSPHSILITSLKHYCPIYDRFLSFDLKRPFILLQRSCDVSCPLDCKLSSWTKYTPCSSKCGAGVKTRFRTIVQKATQGGQMCVSDGENNQIVETIPCIEIECFNFVWKADPWETCKITNQTRDRVAKCGTGKIRMFPFIECYYLRKIPMFRGITFCPVFCYLKLTLQTVLSYSFFALFSLSFLVIWGGGLREQSCAILITLDASDRYLTNCFQPSGSCPRAMVVTATHHCKNLSPFWSNDRSQV